MRRRTIAAALACLAVLAFQASGEDASPAARGGAGPSPADEVAAMLAGSFSSGAQAAADTNYYDIRLEMAPIWADRPDGRWLYVEQAIAGATDRPYRQRVYRVTDRADTVRSEVFTLPHPAGFVGAWRDPGVFAGITPDSLVLRDGCAVLLTRRPDGVFEGGTARQGCRSDLRGAAYATSLIVLSADRLVSWDRGFDESGQQVWGAVGGGYVFDRLAPAGAPPKTGE